MLIFVILLISCAIPIHSLPTVDEETFENSFRQSNYFLYDDRDATTIIRQLYKAIQKYYLPLPRKIDNEDCGDVVGKFLISMGLEGLDSWALKMGDSWGKVLDGFLFGNIHPVGMYEECLKVKGSVTTTIGNREIPFQGKYCKIYFKQIESSNAKSGPGIAVLLQPVPYYYGTCMPSVCTDEDLFISLNDSLQDVGREVLKLECHEADKTTHEREYDGFDAFVIALIILALIFAIFGTIIDENELLKTDLTKQYKGLAIAMKLLACFSLSRGFRVIFAYRKNAPHTITCLHGLRVITLVWIVTCHQYETAFKFVVNTLDLQKYQDPIFGQLITDGYQSVDTFFCISGILLSYRLYPILKANTENTGFYYMKRFGSAFFRRVVRLLPSIFMVAVFCATLIRFMGRGHRQSMLDEFSEQCRATWWKDPIFVNNLIQGQSDSLTKTDCLGHCWYTSVEMQLFLIVPFVFIPMFYNKIGGFLWLSFLTLMSQIIPLIIMMQNDFPPVLFPYLTLSQNYEFYTKYYLTPWCRSSPWFIGIWIGILLIENPRIIRNINKIIVIIGYIIAIAIGFVIVIGLYRYNHVGKHSEIENWVSGFYGFFARPAWALAISWVIVTCHTKNAVYINHVLSWWGWQPLSRLTFALYLITPVVQIWWSSVLLTPIYYNYISKLFEVCGVFFISFVFAVFLSSLVEQPLLTMSDNYSLHKAIKQRIKEKKERREIT